MCKAENLNEKTEERWDLEGLDKSLMSGVDWKAALAVSRFHGDLPSSTVMGLTDYLNLQVMREPENKALMASELLSSLKIAAKEEDWANGGGQKTRRVGGGGVEEKQLISLPAK